VLQQWTYAPSNNTAARVQRQATRLRRGARALVQPDRPVVCFTFDDFPKAALNGADIIEKRGGKAGFYACTSWMGKRSPITGEMFDAATLADLRVRGHEVGAHTHSHLDCSKTELEKIQRDVGANLVALSDAGYMANVSAFAWPFGETTYEAKRWAGEVFATARGTRAGINRGDCDRSQLRAIELGASAAHRHRAVAALKKCVETKGWLFFFAHDVSNSPSPQGAPSKLVEELAKRAADMGAVMAAPTLGAVLCGVID
jgi:peptidoglycan/xylan/chitin deacetylase (PgdA/CDA1 family)